MDSRMHTLRLIAQAKTLEEIADLAFEALGNPIFVEDRSAIKLAYSRNAEIDDDCWKQDVLAGEHILPKQIQVREMLVGYQQSSEEQLPVIVQDNYMKQQHMVKSLYAGGAHVGNIVATAFFREFEPDDIDLLELISGYVINLLEDKNYPLLRNSVPMENLIFQLLCGLKYPNKTMEQYAERFHWNADTKHYAFDIFPANSRVEDPSLYTEILEQFRMITQCQTVIFNNHIVCIYHTEEQQCAVEEMELPFTEILEKYDMVAGISQPFQNLNLLEDYYRQAMAMGGLAVVLKIDTRYYPYDKFACYHMMEICSWSTPLEQFAHHKVKELEQYDIVHSTDLTRTLHLYLESSRSISHTASVMFMHKNTVTYRINKCFDLLGTKIEDNDEVFAFLFSLRFSHP